MLAAVGLLTQEVTTNQVGIEGPAIRHLDLLDEKFPEFGEVFLLICAFIEAWSIINKWEPRSETKSLNSDAFFIIESSISLGSDGGLDTWRALAATRNCN
jgi:hypothetical protein